MSFVSGDCFYFVVMTKLFILILRGYSVFTGKTYKGEIDFVVILRVMDGLAVRRRKDIRAVLADDRPHSVQPKRLAQGRIDAEVGERHREDRLPPGFRPLRLRRVSGEIAAVVIPLRVVGRPVWRREEVVVRRVPARMHEEADGLAVRADAHLVVLDVAEPHQRDRRGERHVLAVDVAVAELAQEGNERAVGQAVDFIEENDERLFRCSEMALSVLVTTAVSDERAITSSMASLVSAPKSSGYKSRFRQICWAISAMLVVGSRNSCTASTEQ